MKYTRGVAVVAEATCKKGVHACRHERGTQNEAQPASVSPCRLDLVQPSRQATSSRMVSELP